MAELHIGDRVRILGTPATLDAELAGCVGRITAKTSGSPSDVPVIGTTAGGELCCVHVEVLDRSYWLASPFLEPADEGPARSAPVAAPAFLQRPISPPLTGMSQLPLLSRFMSRIGRLLRQSFRQA